MLMANMLRLNCLFALTFSDVLHIHGCMCLHCGVCGHLGSGDKG